MTGYRRMLVALFCAGVATFAQLYAPQAVLAPVSRDLGVTAPSAALLISVATFGLALTTIPWSMAADRIGRVPVMTIAVIGATAIALVVPFLPGLEWMVAARFLEGAFLGGVPGVATTYLSEEVEPLHAARAAGVYVAGTSVGGLLGRIVAGPVAEVAGWQAGIVVVALLCLAAAIAFIRLVPPARAFAPSPTTLRQMVAITFCHLRTGTQVALYAQAFLLMGAFVALYNYLAFRLHDEPYGLSQTQVSLLFLAYLAGTWSAAKAGGVVVRLGRKRALIAGALVMALGVSLTLAGPLPVVLLGLLVATAGFFAAHAVAAGWAPQAAADGRAQAASLYTVAYYLGSSVLGWAAGFVLVAAGWAALVGVLVGLVVVSVALAVVLLRPA